MQIGELFVRIRGDITGLQKSMSAAQRAVNGFASDMDRLGKRMTIGVTAPLAALGGIAISAAADLDSLTRGLEAVAGGADAAQQQLTRLREIAKRPAVDLESAAQASIAFQSIGQNAAFAERAIIGVANAVALSGGGATEFNGVLRQMRQIASLGRLMGEELNVILENAPAMATALQKAFGTTSAEAIREMNLTTEEFFERLFRGMEELPQVTGGAANAFDNLRQAFRDAAAAVGERLLPAVVPLVEGMARMLEQVRALNPETVKWGLSVAAAAAAMGPILAVLGNVTKALVALKVAGASIALTFGVGGALLVGLAALTAIFAKQKLEAAEAAGELDEYNKSLASLDATTARFRFNDIQDQLAKARAELEKIERSGQRGRAIGGQLTGGLAENPRAVELREQIAQLEEQFRIVTRRLTDLRNEEGSTIERVITTPAEEAVKALRALAKEVDNLAKRMGQKLANAMQKSGLLQTPKLDAIEIGNVKGAMSDAKGGGGLLSGVIGQVGAQIAGLAAQFGPLAIAAAALKQVLDGFMSVVGPALERLAQPLQDIGAVLGSIIAPVLDALARPLAILGNLIELLLEPLRASVQMLMLYFKPALEVISFVLSTVTKAFSYVIQGIGIFVEALGRFVDSIVPDWLSKAGKGLAKTGQQMQDNAKAIRDNTHKVDDFGESVDRAAASLVNYARVAHINALRFMVGAGMGGTGGGGTGVRPGGRPSTEIIINAVPGAEVLVREGGRVVQNIRSRGGTTRFALAT